jgi:hypothetical protein
MSLFAQNQHEELKDDGDDDGKKEIKYKIK